MVLLLLVEDEKYPLIQVCEAVVPSGCGEVASLYVILIFADTGKSSQVAVEGHYKLILEVL